MMNVIKSEVIKSLELHMEQAKSLGYEIIGLFLQGSQNYGLDYEGSDVDTKAIVLPNFNDFVFNKKPVSFTHVLPNNEHVDIKDIRLMWDCFKKQNINFVEILFTDYMILNPEYEDIFRPMIDSRELIARYNNFAAVNCMAGMAMEKYKALEHPYPATKWKIDRYGFDGKQLSHMIRCLLFIKSYIAGRPYEDCIKFYSSEEKEMMMDIKLNRIGLDDARILAGNTLEEINKVKAQYMQNNSLIVNKEAEEVMDSVMLEILKRKFRKDVLNGQ